jgi:hypothetical protein
MPQSLGLTAFVFIIAMSAHAQADGDAKPWVDQQLGSSAIVISVPSPMEREHVPLKPRAVRVQEEHATYFGYEGDTMLMAIYERRKPGNRTDLDKTVREVIASVSRDPQVVSVEKKIVEETVLGERALYVELVLNRGVLRPLRVRGIFFGQGTEYWQVMLSYIDDAEKADAIWLKLRTSIRRK